MSQIDHIGGWIWPNGHSLETYVLDNFKVDRNFVKGIINKLDVHKKMALNNILFGVLKERVDSIFIALKIFKTHSFEEV